MFISELPTKAMLPRILLVREYDTKLVYHQTKKRISDTYELGIYLDGTGTVTIQGTEYPISRGGIRFTKPGTLLSSAPDYRCITVYFDFGEENTLYRNQILDNIPSYISTNGDLLDQFEALLTAHLSTQPTAPLQQNAILLSLLAALYEMLYTEDKYCRAVRLCLEYMQQHFWENITLETLASITGYSRLHVLRLFKQDLGQTPHQWLTAVRLEHAKKLLSDTSQNIDFIASSCGFNSVSHFKTIFRQFTNCTPGVYRRNTRQY